MDKIAKSSSIDIVKENKSTNGTEEKVAVDCTKQSETAENVTNSTENNMESSCGGEVGAMQVEPLHASDPQEAQLAVKLGLTLPSSCYATMAIRELLKTSTSVCDCIFLVSAYVIMALEFYVCMVLFIILTLLQVAFHKTLNL